jgi:murein L,D-transpeptidase YcbB/YkuD
MKTIILLCIFIATCILSCTNSPDSPVDQGEKNSHPARDRSITATNSYSDLFLDSNTVEQFISRQDLTDTIAQDIRHFYNTRNFEFAWFSSEGLTEQALAFRSLYDYDDSINAKKILDRRLDSLMGEDDLVISASDAFVIKTELLFTWRFINYLGKKYSDQQTKKLAMTRLVPAKKQETLTLADLILSENDNDIIANDRYPALREQLKQYMTVAGKGGWTMIPGISKKIKKGAKDSILIIIKKRFQQTGELNSADTSAIFTRALDSAIRKFQQYHGHKTDGIISASLVDELNIPVIVRVQQLLVNLERMRWMPAVAKGRVVLVNIPEFTLQAQDDNGSAFTMNIVVGKEGHSTVMFTGNIDQVVFSPYWNIPQDIVRKEIIPAMEKNPHYLEEHDMEITGEENGLPVIRQLPGEKNELGKVKFLFPNSFNIYFHDTPHKELFKSDKRAFSHGCIRLSEPARMAEFLLEDQSWTARKIDSAMNGGKEKYVKVKKTVPVLIYYYTAWTDEQGHLQWRDDIYGHDKAMAQKLFTDAVMNSK